MKINELKKIVSSIEDLNDDMDVMILSEYGQELEHVDMVDIAHLDEEGYFISPDHVKDYDGVAKKVLVLWGEE